MSPAADPPGIHTRAAHPPAAAVPSEEPLGLPVYRSSTFRFASAADYADVLADRRPGYVYSRIDNPTADAFAAAVAALEDPSGGAVGQPFASGSAAVSTVLLTLCASGAHVVAPHEVYG
ncbi:MAG TPA: PLP-dependent transferase, partial [Mycobacteriales bacterium]|nr:PLP-dependent transferase [Mycobacteriales bacterium]